MISESFFLDQVRLTRIVATLGPASSSATGIEQLIHAGVDVFRINFSHGNQQQHGEIIHQIQAVSERVSKQVAILQDLSGPKLRISELQADHIHLHTGQKIRLEAGIENGDETRLGFLDENWFSEVHSGERIVLGDGLINLHIEQKDRSGFDCKILSGGILRSRAGLNFPDSNLRLGAMRPQDWKDLQFGLEHQVDAVALSFVQSAQDLIEVRGRMKDYAHQPLLIAKIERSEALLHIDAILDQGDGIMVARGDLGISVPLKKLPTIQKMLIRKAREQRKIVITATQMLESMTFSPMPTRAEVTDVANAVFDGTDAVMLSGETAVGIDPPHVVRTMADILVEAEAHAVFPMLPKIDSAIESALSQIIPLLVKEIGARLVLTPLTSGSTAARISRQRIGLPILAGVNTEQDVRRLRFRHAVFPVLVNPGASFLSNLQNLLNQALERKMVQQDDYAVVTGGFPLDHPGVTNFVRVVQVGADL